MLSFYLQRQKPPGPGRPSVAITAHRAQFYSCVSWSDTSTSRAVHTAPTRRGWGLDSMPLTRIQALHESISEAVTTPVTSGFL